jgi:FkbM family methyltransferase
VVNLDLLLIRVRKLVAIFTHSFFLRAFLRTGVAPAIEHRAVLRRLPFDFVADVGANRGQFSLMCRQLRSAARIVAFEPLAGPAKVYPVVFAGDANARLHNCALGPQRGEVQMHVSASDDASSLLPISKAQSDNFPGTQAVAMQIVAVGPMSDFIQASDMGLHNLLKIDVQGFELEVLKSADTLLSSFEWIYAECSYVALYEGQALAQEIIAFLAERGFALTGQFNPCHARSGGQLLQADLLFERRA